MTRVVGRYVGGGCHALGGCAQWGDTPEQSPMAACTEPVCGSNGDSFGLGARCFIGTVTGGVAPSFGSLEACIIFLRKRIRKDAYKFRYQTL